MAYIIYCPECDNPCGIQHPDRGPSYASGGEQGYAEGIGENFVINGEWYCSQECKDAASLRLIATVEGQ